MNEPVKKHTWYGLRFTPLDEREVEQQAFFAIGLHLHYLDLLEKWQSTLRAKTHIAATALDRAL
jgi:hypothetical protein